MCSASSSGSRRKAWLKEPEEEDNDDDDEAFEMDDDFIPPKKRRSSLPSKCKDSTVVKCTWVWMLLRPWLWFVFAVNPTQKTKEFSSAQAHITFQKVKRLPEKFMGRPIISTDGRKDCVSCGIYLGEIMFLPRGHARFCTKCANKVHDRAHALKRLVLCPVDSCYSSIEGWIRLRNCMV